MKELKDEIDFGREDIPALFRKMLFPTLLGMLFTAVFTITDGIFVGQGIGSEALAAINIVAPLYLFSTGIGLMFGMGGSVVASIHLAAGKVKVARINVTQAILAALLLMLVVTIITLTFSEQILRASGCSDQLLPLSQSYLFGFAPFMGAYALMNSCGFYVRLSGAPKYAMISALIAAVINIVLDYLFIFIFKWGMFGAAVATSLGTLVGMLMMLLYLLQTKHLLHVIRMKLSKKSFLLTVRNVKYMCKVGSSSLLCELAIATMLICGNYAFMQYMGENGVAAFSIACYFFPIIFMVYTSIAQSAQPIISFNYASGANQRVNHAFSLALKTALSFGVLVMVLTFTCSHFIVSMFIPDTDAAHALATHGLPLFAIGFIPFAVNMISIGYFQSVERIKSAMLVTLLRGFIFMIISFKLLPLFIGDGGVWLAVPLSEVLTFVTVLGIYSSRHRYALRSQV